jgi:hypothetical protein
MTDIAMHGGDQSAEPQPAASHVVSRQDARNVKAKVRTVVEALARVGYVGLTSAEGSPAVKVGLKEASDPTIQLPSSIDGVRIVYEVVEPIKALSETAPPAIYTGGAPSHAYISSVLDAWERDTAHMSSSSNILAHPAHDHLASLGMMSASVVLQRMKADGDSAHPGWFSLLHEITGQWPVPEEHAGDHPRMVEHWIAWAYAHASWAFLPIG